jgi:PAS domain S-box-containing protein
MDDKPRHDSPLDPPAIPVHSRSLRCAGRLEPIGAGRSTRGERPSENGRRTSGLQVRARLALERRERERTRAADAALRATEARFETAFETASVPMNIAVRRDGRLLEVNDAFCEATGYDRSELIGRSTSELGIIIPEEREALVGAVLEHGSVRNMEVPFRRRDGSLRRGLVSASPIEVDGEPCLLNATLDMTDRRAAEDALRESEEAIREQAWFMQQLLDTLPFPIIARDVAGRIQLANAAYVAGPGRPLEGAAGGTYAMPNQADVDLHAAHNRPVLETGAVETYEANLYLPDGTVRRQLLTKAPLRSKDGAIAGIVTAGMDISDRYWAEQALQESEERFRTIFDSAGDGILILDESGGYLDANKAALERLGYTRDELRALPPGAIDVTE